MVGGNTILYPIQRCNHLSICIDRKVSIVPIHAQRKLIRNGSRPISPQPTGEYFSFRSPPSIEHPLDGVGPLNPLCRGDVEIR